MVEPARPRPRAPGAAREEHLGISRERSPAGASPSDAVGLRPAWPPAGSGRRAGCIRAAPAGQWSFCADPQLASGPLRRAMNTRCRSRRRRRAVSASRRRDWTWRRTGRQAIWPPRGCGSTREGRSPLAAASRAEDRLRERRTPGADGSEPPPVHCRRAPTPERPTAFPAPPRSARSGRCVGRVFVGAHPAAPRARGHGTSAAAGAVAGGEVLRRGGGRTTRLATCQASALAARVLTAGAAKARSSGGGRRRCAAPPVLTAASRVCSAAGARESTPVSRGSDLHPSPLKRSAA